MDNESNKNLPQYDRWSFDELLGMVENNPYNEECKREFEKRKEILSNDNRLVQKILEEFYSLIRSGELFPNFKEIEGRILSEFPKFDSDKYKGMIADTVKSVFEEFNFRRKIGTSFQKFERDKLNEKQRKTFENILSHRYVNVTIDWTIVDLDLIVYGSDRENIAREGYQQVINLLLQIIQDKKRKDDDRIKAGDAIRSIFKELGRELGLEWVGSFLDTLESIINDPNFKSKNDLIKSLKAFIDIMEYSVYPHNGCLKIETVEKLLHKYLSVRQKYGGIINALLSGLIRYAEVMTKEEKDKNEELDDIKKFEILVNPKYLEFFDRIESDDQKRAEQIISFAGKEKEKQVDKEKPQVEESLHIEIFSLLSKILDSDIPIVPRQSFELPGLNSGWVQKTLFQEIISLNEKNKDENFRKFVESVLSIVDSYSVLKMCLESSGNDLTIFGQRVRMCYLTEELKEYLVTPDKILCAYSDHRLVVPFALELLKRASTDNGLDGLGRLNARQPGESNAQFEARIKNIKDRILLELKNECENKLIAGLSLKIAEKIAKITFLEFFWDNQFLLGKISKMMNFKEYRERLKDSGDVGPKDTIEIIPTLLSPFNKYERIENGGEDFDIKTVQDIERLYFGSKKESLDLSEDFKNSGRYSWLDYCCVVIPKSAKAFDRLLNTNPPQTLEEAEAIATELNSADPKGRFRLLVIYMLGIIRTNDANEKFDPRKFRSFFYQYSLKKTILGRFLPKWLINIFDTRGKRTVEYITEEQEEWLYYKTSGIGNFFEKFEKSVNLPPIKNKNKEN
ncbi:MAG: hypothetical protein N2558_02375 [Patescibacteria group bacterium]|nr:hypothetical protein [Patescibacteria group bacterium]